MPKQTLANFKEPNINGLDAAMVFANTALENIYQAEIEKGGRGVHSKILNRYNRRTNSCCPSITTSN